MRHLALPSQNRCDRYYLSSLGISFKDAHARRILMSEPPIRLVFSLIVMIGIRVARIRVAYSRYALMCYCPLMVVMVWQHVVTQQECVG